jgi:Cu(I)/Ag(I) efflux system membrane protein CusA/SilA
MAQRSSDAGGRSPSALNGLIGFCLENKLVVGLLVLAAVGAGLYTAPFDWPLLGFPRDPVAVDAIPDIGENQQIVFTEWPGRSPQDVEDQVTYPLTTALLGVPGVKTVRSQSLFGFSSIYVIFDEGVDFYWSRSRILEKLNSLPAGTVPEDVRPAIGPDATALGQVLWYTLEGRDGQGRPAGGWDPEELRSIQDWHVRFALASAEGVAEVASIGGFVKEYQIDVDPDAMRAYGVTLAEIFSAVKTSNVDVGARTIEVNRVEYVVRGLGFIKGLGDVENTVIKVNDNVPIYIKDVAGVSFGPALRRGALDKSGAEAVGGVVVVRYGYNPLEAIKNVKEKIAEISPALARKTLADGTVSKVTIVPFYDRTSLIHETLGTLQRALTDEILVTVIVVLVLVAQLRSSLLISSLLPLAVLLCFVAMKTFGVDANIVALSGIAIAIGTMVDMAIVICENILRRLDEAEAGQDRLEVVRRACGEVASAVVTAVATTVVGFLPVFAMTGPEGKLFKPLAFTKTFALVASIIVAITVIPPAAHLVLARRPRKNPPAAGRSRPLLMYAAAVIVGVILTGHWMPLGAGRGLLLNLVFVAVPVVGVLWLLKRFQAAYPAILWWCLRHKIAFLSVPAVLVVSAAAIWSGLGKEFMPPLDEGSFLYMPTTMPHASIGECLDVLKKQDAAFASIPEIEIAVGKIGRAETPLDPAPISMVETVINYKSEYITGDDGRPLRFGYDRGRGEFERDENGNLIGDRGGRPFRQWRDHIKSPDDIWDEILAAGRIPGTTSAPKLQPINARIVMLQSGMRAPMGIKIAGSDLETIEDAGLRLESLLKEVPGVEPSTVIADRIVGKPYLEIDIDRLAIARYGISIRAIQDVIEVAVGGRRITTTVEGRERYPVRVRYKRELRDTIETLGGILVAGSGGVRVPMAELAEIRYVRGPQSIKSEDTRLTGYVLFDKAEGFAEVDVIENCSGRIRSAIASGELAMPENVSYSFAGTYENQVRAQKTLAVVIPLALLIIFVILYLQFKSVATSLMVFSGIVVACSGGFLMIWLYGRGWFLDMGLFGINLREVFRMHPINLSVAIWVGFLALFGIASDDGVVMCTYLDQSFGERKITGVENVRAAVVAAGTRRIRPCLMTTATTVLALLPVLTSTGRGSDIMIPMAIPVFGGMTIEIMTMLVVPVLYCWRKEKGSHLHF